MSDSAFKGKDLESIGSKTNGKINMHSPQSSVSFLVDIADIHSMKQNLENLMTSFRAGKLKAFGDQNAIDQMETIRHMQVFSACFFYQQNVDFSIVFAQKTAASYLKLNFRFLSKGKPKQCLL